MRLQLEEILRKNLNKEINAKKQYTLEVEQKYQLESTDLPIQIKSNCSIEEQKKINYFITAIANGDADSMFKYAVITYNTYGYFTKEAIKYLEKSADKGHRDAMYLYAIILLKKEI